MQSTLPRLTRCGSQTRAPLNGRALRLPWLGSPALDSRRPQLKLSSNHHLVMNAFFRPFFACLLALACFQPQRLSNVQAAPAPELEFQIGAARIDITPDYPVRLTGYAARKGESELPGLKLWAKALAIGSDADGPTLLITVDNCGVCANIIDEVAARLKTKAGLLRERIAVSSSHTHSAPQTLGFAPNIFVMDLPDSQNAAIARYTRQLTDKIEQVALAALKDRRPARLFWSEGKAGFAANRRTRGGPVDHSLPVLCARGVDGKVRAVVANYACHCTTLGGEFNKTCGDWAGFAGETIERDHPGAIALVTIGCGADANPQPRGGQDFGLQFSKQHGEELAQAAGALLVNPMTPLRAKPVCQTKRIELPFQKHFTREEWEERAKKTGIVGYHAKKYLARLDRGETLPATLPYLVQTWSFGHQLALVFLNGEVVVDYALRLKKEFDPARLWVTGYANHVPCYIPSKRILQEGGYEAEDSLWYYDRPQRLAPESEDLIVAAVHDLLPKEFLLDQKRAEFPPPQSAEEALASFRTKPGLIVELVASEPLIVDPVAIDWGADGKLWVAEMRDYPMGLDGKWKPGGRVKFLEDLNGDGTFDGSDRATVFTDSLPFPTGVMAWNKGVLICAAPDIIYAEDTDNDGKADLIQKLFTGFFTDNYQARVNSLSLGLDNWIYGANGLLGGVIHGSIKGQEVNIRGQDFRMKPDTGEFEPAAGLTQQGRVRDDWGNWFGCDNSTLLTHYPLPDHYVRRNPHVPAPEPSVFVPADPDPNQLYPISRTLQRYNDPHTANRTTSACGLGIYRDDLLGKEFYGNAFICEPVHNLVHRQVLEPNGVTFKSHRASDEKHSEFLASTDNWFRPVQVRTGPDGALWVVDMYRFLIEHPRWIPADRLAQIDARAGDDKGRIYRVYPKDAPLRRARDLTKLNTMQLAGALDSRNGTERDRVHLELLRRKDVAAKEPLHKLSKSGPHEAIRLQALAVIDNLGGLADSHRDVAWRDPSPAVRRFEWAMYASAIKREQMVLYGGLIDRSEDPMERFQGALTLGLSKMPAAGDKLAKLLERDFKDKWMRAAILSSATDHSARLLTAAIALPESPERTELIRHLIATGAASPSQIEPTLAAILPKDGEPASWQSEGLSALLRALERVNPNRTQYAAALARLSERHSGLSSIFSASRRALSQVESHPAAPRAETDLTAAIRLIGQDPQSGAPEARQLSRLISSNLPDSLRKTALEAVGRIDIEETPALLLAGWMRYSPGLRGEILSLLLSRESWVAPLLAAIEQGTIRPSEISLPERQRLLQQHNRPLRACAEKLFAPLGTKSRDEIIAKYGQVLINTGNSAAGAEVFSRACASCHSLRGQGFVVGPNLAALRDKDTSYWLKNILDPNAAIEPRYVNYEIETRDGRSLSGIVQAETSSSLTLIQAGGINEKIVRNEIAEIRALSLSLMPEGLEEAITPAEMCDLLVYVRTAPTQFGSATEEQAAQARARFKNEGANGVMHLFASAEKLPYPSWIGKYPLALCRQTDGRSVLKWQTKPVPHEFDTNTTYTIRVPAAMGYASQPKGRFTFKMNNEPMFDLDVTLHDRSWHSADGRVRMTYTVMENNDEDSNGVLKIDITGALLQPGQSVTLEVGGSASASQRWFGIYAL